MRPSLSTVETLPKYVVIIVLQYVDGFNVITSSNRNVTIRKLVVLARRPIFIVRDFLEQFLIRDIGRQSYESFLGHHRA